VGLVCVLGLGACGGGDSETTSADTTDPTTTLPTGSDEAGTPFCGLVRTYSDKSKDVAIMADDPDAVEVAIIDAELAIRRAQDVAPPAINGDVAVVATTYAEVLTGLEEHDFVLTQTPEVAKIQEPGFLTSVSAVYAYARAHCGVT